jgi:hypothetical protein
MSLNYRAENLYVFFIKFCLITVVISLKKKSYTSCTPFKNA